MRKLSRRLSGAAGAAAGAAREVRPAKAARSVLRISLSHHFGPSAAPSLPLVTGSSIVFSEETGPVLIGPCQKSGGEVASSLSSSPPPGPTPPPLSSKK